MRRHDSGAGCGARARGSQPRSREALGRRPSPLRGTAFNGWTRHGRRAAKAARIGLAESRPGPRPEVTAPGTEKPRWRAERRHAPATVRAHVEWPRRLARHPLALARGAGGDDGRPGAAKEYGRRSVGCFLFAPATSNANRPRNQKKYDARRSIGDSFAQSSGNRGRNRATRPDYRSAGSCRSGRRSAAESGPRCAKRWARA
jgi:hypothetical protein